ncbi:YigZ family protein [Finegoldia magna]|uniref:YigZ family protein n=1 Tax=Finegoldia magna TaxID=1260 RepID=UPI002805CBDD|nr:YigZ family protein [Finegoldia magna]MDU5069734.1 YigZ family protein [Finegoldia magna]
MKNYKSIHKSMPSSFIVNKSEFIGNCKFVETEEEALEFVDSIKSKYNDATHNCSAYIIGEDKLIQRFDDDGEPSQTAGIPILEVIKKEDLTNVCVVVTRYYGGIKLGAGGLIRAYTKASSDCLNESIIVDKKIFRKFNLEFDYTNVGSIENFLMNNDIYVSNKEYSDKVVLEILLDEEKYENVENKLIDLTSDNIKFTMLEFTYQSSLNDKLIF